MLLALKETVMRVKVGYARSKKIWGHVDCGEGISGGGWVLLALKETVMRVKVGYVKARKSGDMWIVAKASAGEDGCCWP